MRTLHAKIISTKMAGNSNITSPIAAPPSTSRSLQATVEHADDIEPELYGPSYSVPSSMDSSAEPSKNASIAASDNGENEEEEIWRQGKFHFRFPQTYR